jgi:hypothetical protein
MSDVGGKIWRIGDGYVERALWVASAARRDLVGADANVICERRLSEFSTRMDSLSRSLQYSPLIWTTTQRTRAVTGVMGWKPTILDGLKQGAGFTRVFKA